MMWALRWVVRRAVWAMTSEAPPDAGWWVVPQAVSVMALAVASNVGRVQRWVVHRAVSVVALAVASGVGRAQRWVVHRAVSVVALAVASDVGRAQRWVVR